MKRESEGITWGEKEKKGRRKKSSEKEIKTWHIIKYRALKKKNKVLLVLL